MNTFWKKQPLNRVDEAFLAIAARHVAFMNKAFEIHPALVTVIWSFLQVAVFVWSAGSLHLPLLIPMAIILGLAGTAKLFSTLPLVRDGWNARTHMILEDQSLKERSINYHWRLWPTLLLIVILIAAIPALVYTQKLLPALMIAVVSITYAAPYYTAACGNPAPDKGFQFGR